MTDTETERDEKAKEQNEEAVESTPLTKRWEEREAVEEAAALSPRLIFEAIRRSGEEELARPQRALWNSGVAAGVLIAFSVWTEALLRAYLPASPWAYLLENVGYSVGFVLVIMGRMQLFTENTITSVVPLVITPSRWGFKRTARLWVVVLLANVVGAFAVATFLAYAPVMAEPVREALTNLSMHATGMTALEGMMRGVPAGVLIAALVWMLPSARHNELGLIIFFTWLIALGDFTHIVAGTVEMAFLAVQGLIDAQQAVFGFFLPVLVGNVVGGTAIFTMLTWAQVKADVEEGE